MTEVTAPTLRIEDRMGTVFGTSRAGGEISRLRRRELRLTDVDPDAALVLGLCAEVHQEIGGYFRAPSGGKVGPPGPVTG